MRFLIITHVLHKRFEGKYYAYGPYVREMNLWIKHADKILIVAPVNKKNEPSPIDIFYDHNELKLLKIPQIDILSLSSILRTVFLLPIIIFSVLRGMIMADHIHLRCPGNAGLIGCFL